MVADVAQFDPNVSWLFLVMEHCGQPRLTSKFVQFCLSILSSFLVYAHKRVKRPNQWYFFDKTDVFKRLRIQRLHPRQESNPCSACHGGCFFEGNELYVLKLLFFVAND